MHTGEVCSCSLVRQSRQSLQQQVVGCQCPGLVKAAHLNLQQPTHCGTSQKLPSLQAVLSCDVVLSMISYTLLTLPAEPHQDLLKWMQLLLVWPAALFTPPPAQLKGLDWHTHRVDHYPSNALCSCCYASQILPNMPCCQPCQQRVSEKALCRRPASAPMQPGWR